MVNCVDLRKITPSTSARNHTIEVVVDRLLVKPGIEHRLELSVGLAMKLGGGLVLVAVVDGDETLYSSRLACPDCGINVPQLEPRSFSLQQRLRRLPGVPRPRKSKYDFDPAKVIVDWSKPLLDGGLGPGSASQNLIRSLQAVAVQAYGFDLSTPFEKFPDKNQNLLLNGEPQRGGKTGFQGILGYLRKQSRRLDLRYLSRILAAITCPPPYVRCATASACVRKASR